MHLLVSDARGANVARGQADLREARVDLRAHADHDHELRARETDRAGQRARPGRERVRGAAERSARRERGGASGASRSVDAAIHAPRVAAGWKAGEKAH